MVLTRAQQRVALENQRDTSSQPEGTHLHLVADEYTC